jgi:hypothetical protein
MTVEIHHQMQHPDHENPRLGRSIEQSVTTNIVLLVDDAFLVVYGLPRLGKLAVICAAA